MMRLFFCVVTLCVTTLHPFSLQSQTLPTVHDTLSLRHDGIARTYHLHLPPDPGPDMPLMVVLHGLGGHADRLRYGLGLNALADAMGYAVAYPQGLPSDWGPHWNAGFPFSTADDVGFLKQLARHIHSEFGADPAQTYVMGISAGGFMAYHLACNAADVFHAQAVVIGSMSGQDWRSCTPAAPVSILHIHGTDDPLIPYDGSAHWASGWGGAGPIPAVVARFADRQRAQPVAPLWDLPDTAINSYRNPQNGTEISLVTMLGYGHDWPHRQNSKISAAELIFDFFERVGAARQKQASFLAAQQTTANVVFNTAPVGRLWR